jgi:hypothetical protein
MQVKSPFIIFYGVEIEGNAKDFFQAIGMYDNQDDITVLSDVEGKCFVAASRTINSSELSLSAGNTDYKELLSSYLDFFEVKPIGEICWHVRESI